MALRQRYLEESKSEINENLFESNSASEFGGGIYYYTPEKDNFSYLTIKKNLFVYNRANTGSVMKILYKKPNLIDNFFFNNFAKEDKDKEISSFPINMHLFKVLDNNSRIKEIFFTPGIPSPSRFYLELIDAYGEKLNLIKNPRITFTVRDLELRKVKQEEVYIYGENQINYNF